MVENLTLATNTKLLDCAWQSHNKELQLNNFVQAYCPFRGLCVREPPFFRTPCVRPKKTPSFIEEQKHWHI